MMLIQIVFSLTSLLEIDVLINDVLINRKEWWYDEG